MRLFLCGIALCLYLFVVKGESNLPKPVKPTAVPVEEIGSVAAKMSSKDREAMALAYEMLARAIDSDPEDDPVFVDVATLRRGHRAMLLCLWRGLLDNEPNSVPGLKEAVEGSFTRLIGLEDVPLNPSSRKEIAESLNDIAISFR